MALALLLLLGKAAFAQSPYQGGPGDGYASARVLVSQLQAQIAPDWVRVFPSPATAGDEVRIVAFELTEPLQVEVYDVLGKRIWAAEVAPAGGTARTSLPTQGWAPAAYLLRLRTGDRTFIQKLVLCGE